MRHRSLLMLVLAGLVISLLTACGDPAAIDRAKARRIDQQTEDQSEARAAQEARKQADWEDTRAALNFARQVFFLLVAISLAAAILCGLLVLVVRGWQASRAIVAFAEQRAVLEASTLRLDTRTLTWPALIRDGAVHNLQTGEVYRLGEPKPADPQQVTGDVLIRAIGAGTRGIEQIGKKTRDGQTADAIPALAGAVPLVLRPIAPEESRRPQGPHRRNGR
jgi:hypothetical protein